LKSENFIRRYWGKKKRKFKPNTFYTMPETKKQNRIIRADFGMDYDKASQVAIEIVEELLGLNNPRITNYLSGRLIKGGKDFLV